MKVYHQWCQGYFCIQWNGLPVCHFLHVPSTVKIPLFVLSMGCWWQVQPYLRSTITPSCPPLWLKRGPQSDKINSYCGFHDNDAFADVAVLVHPKKQCICTQNIRGGQNVLFPTLHHFLTEQCKGTRSTAKPQLSRVVWSRVEWIIECLDN